MHLAHCSDGRGGRDLLQPDGHSVRTSLGIQIQVVEVSLVVRVTAGVAGLVAALAGVRALAVAPRGPQRGLQASGRVEGVSEHGGAQLVPR